MLYGFNETCFGSYKRSQTPKTKYYVANHIMLLHIIYISVERPRYFFRIQC